MRYFIIIIFLSLIPNIFAGDITEGGNITALNISTLQQSMYWHGYFGEMSIGDINAQTEITAHGGSISELNFTIACKFKDYLLITDSEVPPQISKLVPGNTSMIDIITGSGSESGGNTFVYRSTFVVNDRVIEDVPTLYTESFNNTFRIGFLTYDGSMVFITNVHPNTIGFDSKEHDFQFILPTPYSSTKVYYFYANLICIKPPSSPSHRPMAVECAGDDDCNADEYCLNNSCTKVPCVCGYIEDHKCIEYECCRDEECASGLCQNGTCAAPLTPVPTLGKDIEIIEYLEEVNMTRGETKLIPVKVKNIGNTKLENISVMLDSIFATKISPTAVDMPVNSTQLFLVRIEIPDDADFMEHRLLVRAGGDGVYDSKTIKLSVVPAVALKRIETVEERIERELVYTWELIEKVWNETVEAGAKGYDVAEIFEILNEAKKNFKLAEEKFKIQNYEDAESNMERMRINLEKAVTKLAEVKAIKVEVFPTKYKIIVFAVVSSLVLTIIIIWRRFRKRLKSALRLQKIKYLIK